MRNVYKVGAVGRHIHVGEIPPTLTPKEALECAAWLVAAAVPLHGRAEAGLNEFHRMLAEAAEGTELGEAAVAALEEEDSERRR
jgi:hypothetical protein